MKGVEIVKGYEIREDGTVFALPTATVSRAGREYIRVCRRVRPRLVDGYQAVKLIVDGEPQLFKVHELVAKAFVPNYGDGTDILHLDGFRSNNSASNLRWCKHG